MFSPGEVVLVTSNQAAGYRSRNKYHLCICGHQGKYLFINSRPWQGSFTITQADFPNLPNNESHIACNTIFDVSDQYMRENNAQLIGRLNNDVVQRLIDHIEQCDVMTEDEKELVIDGLTGAL